MMLSDVRADHPLVHPRTSVIICSRGRPELLLDAVRSVLSMSHLPHELVVVDQSEKPQEHLAAARLTRPVALTYLWSPDRGLSRARNVGVGAATGDVLAFLDDDMLAESDWLLTLTGLLAELGPDHVVTGQVRAGEPEVPGAWAPSTITQPAARSYSGQLRRDVLYPNNMGLFRSAFAEIGLFDERLGAGSRFPSAEDNDLCRRLLLAGYVIDYRPEVVAVHRAWRRPDARSKLAYNYGRGQGAFYVKHLSRRDAFMLGRLAEDVYRHVSRAAVRTARSNIAGARSDLAYTRGVLGGAVAWSRTR